MFKHFLSFSFTILTLVACKFNPNIQGQGVSYLQGSWKQDQALYEDKLLAYTLHTINFSCDSFYLTLDTRAKTNIYPDSCFNKGQWTEYVKGIYSLNKDTLYLDGTFTKSNFKQKISGCYRIGQYRAAFAVQQQGADTLLLKDATQHIPLLLRLKQKTICNPQPVN